MSGNSVNETNLSGATTTLHWYYLSAIDVYTSGSAVVVIGDSITDGRGCTYDGNDRRPNVLDARLPKVAVLNQAAGGNYVTKACLGDAAKDRFDRDALDLSGVKWIVLLEGINDFNGGTQAQAVECVYEDFITKAHAGGVKTYGGLLTPVCGPGGVGSYCSSTNNQRVALNDWIRNQAGFDGVMDFESAVSVPGTNPLQMAEQYKFVSDNDYLQLSPAGYQAMGEAVDTAFFR